MTEAKLIPEDVEKLLTPKDVFELIERFKRAEAEAKAPDAPLPEHKNFFDELLEMSTAMRLATSAHERKKAVLDRAERIFRLVLSSHPPRFTPMANERTIRFSRVAILLGEANASPLCGSTSDERSASFRRLSRHIEGIWSDAALLLEAGSFARACFMAITCLEEIGKATFARLELKLAELAELSPTKRRAVRRRENPAYSHGEKHFLAAAGGALFNARLEDVLGAEELEGTISLMESGGLIEMREKCLYFDESNDGIHTYPSDEISESVARKWLVVAGEILAEVLGYPNPEWERLVGRVQAFEERIGWPVWAGSA